MAAWTTIDDSASKFKTLTYTGTGSALSITGVGFAPNIVYTKVYTGGDKTGLSTIPTGTAMLLQLSENATVTGSTYVTGFDADGFTLGTGTEVNWNTYEYINYNWLANTTTGIDTTGSTITPTSYTLDQDAGVSFIRYTGNKTAAALVPHGLAATPDMILVKNLDASENWACYHKNLDATAPEDKYLQPNTDAAVGDNLTHWNDTAPTSVNFSLGTADEVNGSSDAMVAWCFKGKQGYSRFSTFIGNANVEGTMVMTGFRPAFIWIKSLDASDWYSFDEQRVGYNPDNNNLTTDGTVAQNTTDRVNILSNGFKFIYTGEPNTTSTYIYAAFAHSPFCNSNGAPANAR